MTSIFSIRARRWIRRQKVWFDGGMFEQPSAAHVGAVVSVRGSVVEVCFDAHLRRIIEQAQTIVGGALAAAPRRPGKPSETIVEDRP